MIKVMLVDDQNLVRKGVRSLLELSEEIEVTAEAADGSEAIRMIPEVQPDVVLLDMRMPGLSGLDVLRELSQADALPPTIILTTFDDDELVLAGIIEKESELYNMAYTYVRKVSLLENRSELKFPANIKESSKRRHFTLLNQFI